MIKRGGRGVQSLKITPKTGNLITIKVLFPEKSELLLYTNDGMIERINTKKIRITNRVAQGVKLISIKGKNSDQKVINAEIIDADK
jgi:DNA gyrase subunit A